MIHHRYWIKAFMVGTLFSVFLSVPTFAQDQTRAVADSVMDDVATRIAANKFRYLVFSNFDPAALPRNPDGFKELRYAYPLAEGRNLEVNVVMISLKSKAGKEMTEWNHREFPLLGIKVLWTTARTGFYLEGFDLNPIVEDAIWPLVELQQKQLPLRMTIETPKAGYQVGEPVNLDLVVKNISGNTLRVKPLDSQSVYCVMNEEAWGIKDAKPTPSKSVLRAGEEMRYLLKIKGLEAAGDLTIACSYGIGFQGVRPQARKVLKIENNAIKDN
jgi:hypothetical protein